MINFIHPGITKKNPTFSGNENKSCKDNSNCNPPPPPLFIGELGVLKNHRRGNQYFLVKMWDSLCRGKGRG